MRIILASSSPRRREILGEMVTDFEIIKPEIDETQHNNEAPLDYVKRLSQEKAQAVASQLEDSDTAILAADTVVILAADTIGIEANGEILGKPIDADDARSILRRLRNRAHHVCTAFTLQRGGYQHTEVVTTEVHMRDYSDDEIEAYIATGDPFDKAGSYAIQHEGFHPVREIVGSYQNVVGLPAEAVKQALIGMGVDVKGVNYTVQFRGHQILEFIPTDDPHRILLDSDTPMTFAIALVRKDDKHLLHFNPQRDQWEIGGGGGIEAGEHPHDTAIRELYEETGQIVEQLDCIGVIKIHFMHDDVLEYAVLYKGTLNTLSPFTPNAESSEIRLWDGQSALEGQLSQISYAVLKYS